MLSNRVSLSWLSSQVFAPDRIRAFLGYLARETSPLRVSDLPSNLYTTSESLSKGCPRLDVALEASHGHRHSGGIAVIKGNGGNDFKLLIETDGVTAEVLASRAVVDVLAAGARILGAESGTIAIESAQVPGLISVPIATWLSPVRAANFDRSQTKAIVVLEEWDGAVLAIRRTEQGFHFERQVVRQLISRSNFTRNLPESELLCALESEDWEVRASAMLGAARLGLQSLGLAVKRMAIPDKGPSGVTSDIRHMLLAMHKACLLLLSGTLPPEMADEAPDTRPGMQAHLLRCVAGFPVKFYEDFFLLMTALTQPLPLVVPQPASLPEGLERGGNGIYRSRNLEFVWVPPVAGWLGAGTNARQHTPERGYFIARWPLRSSASDEYLQTSLASAREIAEEFSSSGELPLVLPSADEWEMAARGPDARLFPWGNGWQMEMLTIASPWGMRDCVGSVGQWTAEGFVCGTQRDPRCAGRSDRESAAAIRLKINPLVSS
jgi:hypothetical protein